MNPNLKPMDEEGPENGSPRATTANEEHKIPGLSKNQMKKQMRLQRWATTKNERRKKEREKIKERKKMMEERKNRGLDEIVPILKKRRMSDPEASDIRVAIDCAYDDFMSEPDIKKLIKQIQRCYAENRKSAKPLQLYLASLRDKTKELMDKLIQGYQNWDVHLHSDSPDQAFGSENIVYLAAESPNVLQELDPTKVYIIGGLVDHNHHKGVCFKRVVERGWSHMQLPIGDYVKLNSRKILAVNHVYEILLSFIQVGNWREAFNQVLPNRKVKEYIDGDASISEPDQSAARSGDGNLGHADSFRSESSPSTTVPSDCGVVVEGNGESSRHGNARDEGPCEGRISYEEESTIANVESSDNSRTREEPCNSANTETRTGST